MAESSATFRTWLKVPVIEGPVETNASSAVENAAPDMDAPVPSDQWF